MYQTPLNAELCDAEETLLLRLHTSYFKDAVSERRRAALEHSHRTVRSSSQLGELNRRLAGQICTPALKTLRCRQTVKMV